MMKTKWNKKKKYFTEFYRHDFISFLLMMMNAVFIKCHLNCALIALFYDHCKSIEIHSSVLVTVEFFFRHFFFPITISKEAVWKSAGKTIAWNCAKNTTVLFCLIFRFLSDSIQFNCCELTTENKKRYSNILLVGETIASKRVHKFHSNCLMLTTLAKGKRVNNNASNQPIWFVRRATSWWNTLLL